MLSFNHAALIDIKYIIKIFWAYWNVHYDYACDEMHKLTLNSTTSHSIIDMRL